MNNEQAIKVLLDEWKCIDRNDGINCDRQCEKCDLVMDSAILKDAYNMAIQALSQEPCDDAISREAVIMECIKYADHEYNVQLKKEVSETRKHDAQVIIYACDYFKTFVEKLPSVTQNPIECDDVISRQAAIDAMYALCDTGETLKENQWRDNPHIDAIIDAIDNLPSVTHKSGKWIEHPEIETSTPEYLMFYECSECGNKQCFCKSDIHKKRFCSNCGAKMEVEE